MNQYSILIFLLATLVNVALLMGTARLCGRLPIPWKIILGSVAAGVYAAVSFVTDLQNLNELLMRTLVTLLIGLITLGKSINGVLIYLILTFAVEGMVTATNSESGWGALLSAGLILSLGLIYFREKKHREAYVPVELNFAGKSIKVMALRDTGNLLVDPVSGMPVLVVALRVAQELTGLSKQQLQHPVEVMRHPPIPGLRLIPYRTITQAEGVILGVRISSVRIGDWWGKLVVAFAPEEFSNVGDFEALMGGTL